jgi:hypothetical protein
VIRRVAADARLAAHAGFWWGLAEGVAFFIVPDVYISFATLFSVRAGAVAWAASIAGSLVAILAIRLTTALASVDYLGLLGMIPGISGELIRQVTAAVETTGLPYTPFLVLGGVPLKLYAAAAFSSGLSLGAVLLWTAFARIVRIAPTFLAIAVLRGLLHRHINSRPGAWLAALLVFWVGFYALYFQRMSSQP